MSLGPVSLLGLAVLGLAVCVAVTETWVQSQTDRAFTLVKNGEEEPLRKLLQNLRKDAKASYDIDMKDRDGWTLLHHAVYAGHLKVVELLHQYGISLNAQTPEGKTALYLAAEIGNEPMVKFLVSHQSYRGSVAAALQTWVCRGKSLFAVLNGSQDKGWTPLHVASATGCLPIVEHLIRYIARDIHDKEGKTPIDLARTDAVRQLLWRDQR